MPNKRTLVTGGQLITVDDDYGDIPEGAVLIEDGKIAEIGRSKDAFDGVDAEVIDAEGGGILPGMVDSHRHTWLALMRAVSADHSLLRFLATISFPRGASWNRRTQASPQRWER